jgi:hypothetical protein
MKPIFSLFIFSALTLVSTACHVKRVDNTEIREMIKSEKILKITDKEMVIEASSLGLEIKDSLLKSADPCSVKQIGSTKISFLASPSALQDKNKKLREVIEAYAYAEETKTAAPDNVQKINDSTIVYTFMNTKAKSDCLNQIALLYLSKKTLVARLRAR